MNISHAPLKGMFSGLAQSIAQDPARFGRCDTLAGPCTDRDSLAVKVGPTVGRGIAFSVPCGRERGTHPQPARITGWHTHCNESHTHRRESHMHRQLAEQACPRCHPGRNVGDKHPVLHHARNRRARHEPAGGATMKMEPGRTSDAAVGLGSPGQIPADRACGQPAESRSSSHMPAHAERRNHV